MSPAAFRLPPCRRSARGSTLPERLGAVKDLFRSSFPALGRSAQPPVPVRPCLRAGMYITRRAAPWQSLDSYFALVFTSCTHYMASSLRSLCPSLYISLHIVVIPTSTCSDIGQPSLRTDSLRLKASFHFLGPNSYPASFPILLLASPHHSALTCVGIPILLDSLIADATYICLKLLFAVIAQ